MKNFLSRIRCWLKKQRYDLCSSDTNKILRRIDLVIQIQGKIMETVDTLTEKANTLVGTVRSLDTKLDEVREYIATLGLPQDKLDALGAILDSGKTEASTVLAEADALDAAKDNTGGEAA